MVDDRRKYKGKKFINAQYHSSIAAETIDEFNTSKQAKQMLKEYRLAYGNDLRLWISQRPCTGW